MAATTRPASTCVTSSVATMNASGFAACSSPGPLPPLAPWPTTPSSPGCDAPCRAPERSVSTPVQFRSLAEADLRDATEHYRRQAGAATALAFLDPVEQGIRRIGRHPQIGSLRSADELAIPHLRAWPLSRFPSLVVSVVGGDAVRGVQAVHAPPLRSGRIGTQPPRRCSAKRVNHAGAPGRDHDHPVLCVHQHPLRMRRTLAIHGRRGVCTHGNDDEGPRTLAIGTDGVLHIGRDLDRVVRGGPTPVLCERKRPPWALVLTQTARRGVASLRL